MIENSRNLALNDKELRNYLKNEVLKEANKINDKFPPISELIEETPKILKIKEIYQLNNYSKYLYLINTKNYLKNPKIRYFLAILLASQSSDLLVKIANSVIIKQNSKIELIQFSIYPKSLRINLLSLKEITNIKDFQNSIEVLKKLRNNFRNNLEKFKNLIENK